MEAELLHTYSRIDPYDVLILCVRVAVLTAVTLTVPIVLFPVRTKNLSEIWAWAVVTKTLKSLCLRAGTKSDSADGVSQQDLQLASPHRHCLRAAHLHQPAGHLCSQHPGDLWDHRYRLQIIHLIFFCRFLVFQQKAKNDPQIIDLVCFCSGATSAPCLIFIFPAVFYIRIVPKEEEPMRSLPKILVSIRRWRVWHNFVQISKKKTNFGIALDLSLGKTTKIDDVITVTGLTFSSSFHHVPLQTFSYFASSPSSTELLPILTSLSSLSLAQAACFAGVGFLFMIMSLSFIIIDWTSGSSKAVSGH